MVWVSCNSPLLSIIITRPRSKYQGFPHPHPWHSQHYATSWEQEPFSLVQTKSNILQSWWWWRGMFMARAFKNKQKERWQHIAADWLYRRQERFGQNIQGRIQGKRHALFRMLETLNKNTWGASCRAVLPKQARGWQLHWTFFKCIF